MSEANQFSEDLDYSLTDLYEARLGIWAFDFENGSKAITNCIKRLEKYSSSMDENVALVKSLRKELKTSGTLEKRIKFGEVCREYKINTDFFLAYSIKMIAERYENYLKEIDSSENKEQLRARTHKSGFRYVVFPIGTEKYEFRAYNTQGNSKSLYLLADKLNSFQNRFPSGKIKTLEKINNENNEAYIIKFRLFLESATTDMMLSDDGTIVGEILVADHMQATEICESILDLLIV